MNLYLTLRVLVVAGSQLQNSTLFVLLLEWLHKFFHKTAVCVMLLFFNLATSFT